MDDHRLSKRSYKISIESRKSNLSSCRSLQRPSWCEREKSLSNKHSLIDVMSLQGGKGERKSDIFDKMLDVPSEPLFNRQSLGGQGRPYNYTNNYNDPYYQNQYQFDAPSSLNQRKSEETNGNIKHTCSCYTDCEWQRCECFLAKNQMCIKQFCCIGCIEMKQKMLRGYQIPIQNEQPHQGLFCTCKKTKCNKKYCSCFAVGVHCGQKCSCQGCINCPRKSQHMEIEQQRQEISQEELARIQMPESMDFEPVQFRMSNT